MTKRFTTASLRSLAVKLPLLTLLWVSFIVSSIGYTMLLNWELEASAAAKFAVGELRNNIYRTALVAQPATSGAVFEREVRETAQLLQRIEAGNAWQPLYLPKDESVRKSFEQISSAWRTAMLPKLREAHETGTPVNMGLVRLFTEQVTALTDRIDTARAGYLWQLRYLQVLLIVLAIGSLFVIVALLLNWVIRPLERLGDGIRRLSSGDLTARVEIHSRDEVGQIAHGFNRMADRLEDLYDNLEQKVAEKTVSVEEKNRHLAQLYEITSFFSQQAPIEEMLDGFVERIIRYTEADGCVVELLNQRSQRVHAAAFYGLGADTLKAFRDTPYEGGHASNVLAKYYPIRVRFATMETDQAKALVAEGFRSGFAFQVRSSASDVGVLTLVFRDEPEFSSQMVQLLESFSSHLGVAIDNRRLIERDRQFAVVQERQLLAQGLHDSIAQALSFLNLQVQFLSDAIKTDDKQLRDDSLSAIQTGVQECYEDVRELLLNFRERLHKEGFVDGIQTVIDRFEGQSGVAARLTVTGNGPDLTEKQKLQVIFIVQEALSNVRKHAEADTVEVRIDNQADLRVTVTDDGVGLDDKLVAERRGQHVGLSIMSERASKIGATVTVERASPIGGTRVTLVLPADARGEG